MRLHVLVALMACLLLYGYGCSGDSVDEAEREAAELVNAHLQDDSPKSYIPPGTLLNLEKHESGCLIGEGSTTGVAPMPAKCEWSAGQEGTETLVELVENWKCSDFNERAGRPEFCPTKDASHTWFWAIDEAKEVRYLGDEGDTKAESFYLPPD